MSNYVDRYYNDESFDINLKNDNNDFDNSRMLCQILFLYRINNQFS